MTANAEAIDVVFVVNTCIHQDAATAASNPVSGKLRVSKWLTVSAIEACPRPDTVDAGGVRETTVHRHA